MSNAEANKGQRNLLNEIFPFDDLTFLLPDSLPKSAECVLAIDNHAPRYGSNNQKDHIH